MSASWYLGNIIPRRLDAIVMFSVISFVDLLKSDLD